MNKKETIEEAANKSNGYKVFSKDTKGRIFNEGFIEGAKWQSNRMYSEEDMHKAYCAGSDFDMSSLKEEQYYMFKEWFEQFKKK